MKKIIVLAALAFAQVAGTAVVLTIHPQHAFADPNGGGGGNGGGVVDGGGG